MIKFKKQRGFGILAVILTIVVLIGFVSFVTFKKSDSSNLISNTNTINTLVSQASIIRSRILACGIEYPTGNNGTTYRVQYPAATTLTDISNLTCPGANNANIWTLLDGLSAPLQINGFNNWQYINDGSGMKLSITAVNVNKGSLFPQITTALGSGQASYNNLDTIPILTWKIVE